MSISPATWPKALRWNRALLLIALLGGVIVSPLAAELAERMLLERGPFREKGLPFGAHDLSLYYRGLYSIGERELEIYFIPQPAGGSFDGWEATACGEGVLQRAEAGQDRFYYRPFSSPTREDGALLLRAAQGESEIAADVCRLLRLFSRRFSYFLGTTPDWYLPPFPAVIEVPATQAP